MITLTLDTEDATRMLRTLEAQAQAVEFRRLAAVAAGNTRLEKLLDDDASALLQLAGYIEDELMRRDGVMPCPDCERSYGPHYTGCKH